TPQLLAQRLTAARAIKVAAVAPAGSALAPTSRAKQLALAASPAGASPAPTALGAPLSVAPATNSALAVGTPFGTAPTGFGLMQPATAASLFAPAPAAQYYLVQ